MEEYDYDDEYMDKRIAEIRKPTKYQGPDYNEEYLKQFEKMKPGERFTQDQLEKKIGRAHV